MLIRNRATMGNSRPWYEIKAAVGESVDVLIYDEISPWGVDAQQFARELAAITAQTINLHINSPGGSVFDGTAIYNAIKAHPAKVVTHIDGVAASIASIIALAGNEVRMAANAYYMIHNPWGVVIGDAAEMRKTSDVLDKIAGTLAATYAAKCGKPKDEVQALMDAETWMTADEALAAGFVDVVEPAGSDAKASFDLSGFTNAPAALQSKPGPQDQVAESEAESYAPDTRKMRARLAFLNSEIAG